MVFEILVRGKIRGEVGEQRKRCGVIQEAPREWGSWLDSWWLRERRGRLEVRGDADQWGRVVRLAGGLHLSGEEGVRGITVQERTRWAMGLICTGPDWLPRSKILFLSFFLLSFILFFFLFFFISFAF
jgi:hypothetical protein